MAPLSKDELVKIFPTICGLETSALPDSWTANNPLLGHCAVVALVAQKHLGGTIRRISLIDHPRYAYMGYHYLNLLPNGELFDFSSSQFPSNDYPYAANHEHKDVTYVLSNEDTKLRFKLLSLKLASELDPKSTVHDAYYETCYGLALESQCKRMRSGAIVVKTSAAGEKETIITRSGNGPLEPLRGWCENECASQSFTDSKQAAQSCTCAEKFAIWKAKESGVIMHECDIYVARVTAEGLAEVRTTLEFTCLSCAEFAYLAGIRSLRTPWNGRWAKISPRTALGTAKEYSLVTR